MRSLIANRDGIPLLQVPSLVATWTAIEMASLELFISSTLLIDIGLILRYVNRQPAPNDKHEKSILFKAPVANVTVSLSDRHNIVFALRNATLRNQCIGAKSFSMDAGFEENNYRFMEGGNAQFSFQRPLISLTCRKCDISLTHKFAELNYIQECLSLISWLVKQVTGRAGPEPDEPSTSRRFAFQVHRLQVVIERPELCDRIQRSVEAKRLAMEGLMLRQAKALQILAARGVGIRKPESFDRASQQLLFALYRKTFAKIPSDQNHIIELNAVDFECVIDGPAVTTRGEALRIINQVVPETAYEQVGRIFGGQLTISAQSIEIAASRIGPIMQAEALQSNGFLFLGRKQGETRRDFYHFLITCDGDGQTFVIPRLASKSTFFLDLTMKCQTASVFLSPAMSEFKQDIELATAVFRKKGHLYKSLAMYDLMRLRLRSVLRLEAEKLHIHLRNKQSPFASSGIAIVDIASFRALFDGRESKLTGESLAVRLFLGNDFRQVVTFPRFIVNVRVNSKNPLNENGTHPVFLPVDSGHMGSPSYDPFERCRTLTYEMIVNVSFETNSRMLLFLDDWESLADAFGRTTPIRSSFVKPVTFVTRIPPQPVLTASDVSVKFPRIAFSNQQLSITGTIFGDPIALTVITAVPLTVAVASGHLTCNVAMEAKNLLTVQVVDVQIEKKGALTTIGIRSAQVESSAALRESLVSFHRAKSSLPGIFPDFKTEGDLFNHFTVPVLAASLDNLTLNVALATAGPEVRVYSTGLKYQKLVDQHTNALHVLQLGVFQFFTAEAFAFISLQNGDFKVARIDSYQYGSAKLGVLDLHIRPDDVRSYGPEFSKFTNVRSDTSECHTMRTRRGRFDVDSLTMRIINNESMVLALLTSQKITASYLSCPDNSGLVRVTVLRLRVVDEQAGPNDKLRTIVERWSKDPIMDMSFERAPTSMKYPVYSKIELTFAPTILSLPLKFISSLIKLFPTANDLRILTLDPDDPGEEVQGEDVMGYKDRDEDDEQKIFCQEFIFNAFEAEFNLRRKEKGLWSELTNLNLGYKGVQVRDIFGTPERLKAFAKRQFRSALRQTAARMLFRKKRRSATSDSAASDDV
jgi:hypothetical protein